MTTYKEEELQKSLDAIAEAAGLVDHAEGQGPQYGTAEQIIAEIKRLRAELDGRTPRDNAQPTFGTGESSCEHGTTIGMPCAACLPETSSAQRPGEARPICSRCNDTHRVPAPEDHGSEWWMCTSCPTPCQQCRVGEQVFALPAPYRHHHILHHVLPGLGVRYVDADDKEQGFLDASGRFLTRKQALVSAELHDQIKNDGKLIGSILTSEDLW